MPDTSWVSWLLAAVLAGLGVFAYLTIELDHPFLIASHSRALYVDEGFYSDAAQNFAKFGRWGFPYDFPHWAGAPSVTLLQSFAFPVFGPELATARMLSVVLSLATALVFYALLRMSLRPFVAALTTISGVLTFNYVAHARSALADPIAVCFAMLALAAFARIHDRRISIPVSIGLAFLASLSKLYFIFTFATILGLWLIELVIAPAAGNRKIPKRDIAVLGLSLAAVATALTGFLYRFGHHVASYQTINTSKLPGFDVPYLLSSLGESMTALPYNTKATLYLAVIPAAILTCLILLAVPPTRAAMLSRFAQLNRGELAVTVWLGAGLLTIGVVQIPKPHYHFFAILPLVFVGTLGLRLVLPERLRDGAVCLVAILHLAYQWPFYEQWAERRDKTAFLDASRQITRYIHKHSDDGMIPVIGEYAAQLGLFSSRVFSLDVKWSPDYPFCDRVAHWRPRYHVNVVWPGSVQETESAALLNCRQVAEIEELFRLAVFPPRNDELVLSRIDYEG